MDEKISDGDYCIVISIFHDDLSVGPTRVPITVPRGRDIESFTDGCVQAITAVHEKLMFVPTDHPGYTEVRRVDLD